MTHSAAAPPVIYEDADVLAVCKPSGVCVIPARSPDGGPSLRETLEAARGAKLWVVHRLDRGTSGVLLFAKNAAAHAALNAAFEGRRVSKSYLALVCGAPVADSGVMDAPLRAARKGRMRPALPGEPGALACRSSWRVVRRFGANAAFPSGAALIAFRPETGRQHQLRVHARCLGTPIAGDDAYGGAAGAAAPRLMLHASEVVAPHPTTGRDLALQASPPGDFEAVIASLDAVS